MSLWGPGHGRRKFVWQRKPVKLFKETGYWTSRVIYTRKIGRSMDLRSVRLRVDQYLKLPLEDQAQPVAGLPKNPRDCAICPHRRDRKAAQCWVNCHTPICGEH